PGVTRRERILSRVAGFFYRDFRFLGRRRSRRQAHHLSLGRIVVFIDIADAQRVGLLLAGLGFVPGVVLWIAIKPVLDQQTNRKQENRSCEKNPLSPELLANGKPKGEHDDREIHRQVAQGAYPGSLVATNERRAVYRRISDNLEHDQCEQQQQV